MIRKKSHDGVGYSVVDLHGVSHILAAAVPVSGHTTTEQTHDALGTIQDVIDNEGAAGRIVSQSVFYRDPADHDLIRGLIRDFYGEAMPATTFICQPPCCQNHVSIEALGVGRVGQPFEIHRYGEKCVVARHAGVTWYHCGPVTPRPSAASVYDRSYSTFERLGRMLRSKGARFENVIRTWLYQGNIVGMEEVIGEDEAPCQRQRYQELNRARCDFYRGVTFTRQWTPPAYRGAIYPASTGIGSDNGDLVASCIAVDGTPGAFAITPLENPQQTSAFDYGECYGPKSPKFARAMAVAGAEAATIFISGTASITHSETQWPRDVARQTHQTLDNIAALISERNLARHSLPRMAATLEDLACVRVYIKRQEDYEAVRAVCEARLGELPAVYAKADVCRDDLLVEVEGMAFVRRHE